MGGILNLKNQIVQDSLIKLKKTISPCQVYRIEHFRNGMRSSFSRIVIEHHPDNFIVNHWQVEGGKLGKANIELSLPFRHRHLADEKVDEIATCLELEGWIHVRDTTHSIFDVSKAIFDMPLKPLNALSVREFQKQNFHQNECYLRPMINGIHAIAVLDPYQTIKLATIRGGIEKIEFSDFSVLKEFGNVEGAKGFAAEGIWTGTKFFISDVIYLHDNWLLNMGFNEKEKLFNRYLDKHGLVSINKISLRNVRISALGALFGELNRGLLVYNEKGERWALSETEPKAVSFGCKRDKRFELCDNNLSTIGKFSGFGNLDLSYKEFISLNIENTRTGIGLLLI